MNMFLDDEGVSSKGEGGLNWLIVNTRQTMHKRHKIDSTNPFIVWRMMYLESLKIPDFQWKKVIFDRKNKSILSVGCAFKSLGEDLIPYDGVITFEEAINDSILKFVPETLLSFQIIFVFENDVIRCIEFQDRKILSSRLLSSLPEAREGFIVSDKDIENVEIIRTIDFCGSLTLKDHVLKMDFYKVRNLLNPPEDFPFSYSSYHGKERAKKHIFAFVLIGFLSLLVQFQSSFLNYQSNQIMKNIKSIEFSLAQNKSLQQKKDFFKEYFKKKWNTKDSILSHLNELGFIVESGFYVYDLAIINSDRIHMILKPFTENSQVLLKFQTLEKKFKSLKSRFFIHKPPYGLEKGKKKSCSKSKIEIVWGDE